MGIVLGTSEVRVLIVPGDAALPLVLRDLSPSRFPAVLGGPPERIRALTEAQPIAWQVFVRTAAAAERPNYRATRLSTWLGGQPGRIFRGTAIFTGRGPTDGIRGVPGIVNQMARLMGQILRAQE